MDIRLIKLYFHRSFSGRDSQQLLWFSAIICLALFALLGLTMILFPTGNWSQHLYNIFCLFIDPGSITNESNNFPKWMSIIITILGIILFCGILISVIVNILSHKVEDYREGHIEYPFNNHIVIIGYSNLVPPLIKQILNYNKRLNDLCYILILTEQDVLNIRKNLQVYLNTDEEKHIVFIHGKRSSVEVLEKLRTKYAKSIYVIGEDDDNEVDSINIECINNLVLIHKKQNISNAIPLYMHVEDQTTFAIFQNVDITHNWKCIFNFCPLNYYEEWARKVFCKNETINNTKRKLHYPSKPITKYSEQNIHIVIMGINKMGIAIALEAARLYHFANFCQDSRYRTIITFIDNNAETKMNEFIYQYKQFFEISSTSFYDTLTGIKREIMPSKFKGKEANFLDVQFDFIQSQIEHPIISNNIAEWSSDEKQQLLIAICFENSSTNLKLSMHLPHQVYLNNIPILTRQETSSALIELFNLGNNNINNKYSNIYPFGMKDEWITINPNRELRGKLINYLYERKLAHDLSSSYEEITNAWNSLTVSNQWASIHLGDSFEFKIDSLNLYDFIFTDKEFNIEEKQLMSEIEHNRWNVEKLLQGFRKPTEEDYRLIQNEILMKTQWHIHKDIRPFNELNINEIYKDELLCMGIPLILKYEKKIMGTYLQ